MTPRELLQACAEQTKIGLPFLIVTIPIRRRTGMRVRVLPGVLGHVVGSTRERLHVSVQIRHIVAWLERMERKASYETHPLTKGPAGGET